MRNEDALLFLSYLNFDYKIKDELLNHFTLEHIEDIFEMSEEYFKENKLLTKNNIDKLVEERKKFNSDAYREFLEKKKVKFVSVLSENYPVNLKDIEYIPQVIYYKGDILPEDEFALSIVGSRKCTNYGAWATEYFARSISEFGIRIVSGMALGIDSISHRAALKSGGRTIAVLGCGVDMAYPKTNYRLYEEIIENGAVMSEFPVGMPPLAHNFPVRNRIISGLSKALLVIEAQDRSGTLITSRFANEQSKEIFALPGNINSLYSKGTNKLIKDGALIATDYQDIIDGVIDFSEFILNKNKEEKDLNILDAKELLIFNLINEEPKSQNKISTITGFSIIEINTILTSLELKGFIKELNGGIFVVD